MASSTAGSAEGGSSSSSSSVLNRRTGDLCLRSWRIFPHHPAACLRRARAVERGCEGVEVLAEAAEVQRGLRAFLEAVRVDVPQPDAAVTGEVDAYKKFKLLVEGVTELSLEASRLRHKRE